MADSKTFPDLFNRAAALLNERRFEEGLEVWNEMDQLFPRQPGVLINKAYTLCQLNRKDDAVFPLMKVLALDPSNDHALSQLKSISPLVATLFANVSSDMATMKRMKGIGFVPESIVDVGAYDGSWIRQAKTVFPESHCTLIDPLEENEAKLRAFCSEHGSSNHYIKALLSDSEKEVDFYISDASNKTGSTLYRENTNIKQSPHKLTTRTLDQVLSADRRYDFIKLDVQGAEIDVLRGGSETLKHTEFIFMEMALLEYNTGAPLMTETVQFMDQIGFRCIDVADVMRYVWTFPAQINLLFIRKGSSFLPESFNL